MPPRAATPTVYRFALSGAYDAAWMVDTDAPVDGVADLDQGFGYYDVEGTFGGVARTASALSFFHRSVDGGLSVETGGRVVPFFGPQLFTGTERSPTFRIGSFPLDGGRSTVTIASAATGQPATWLMTIVGFGVPGASMRVHRPRTATGSPRN